MANRVHFPPQPSQLRLSHRLTWIFLLSTSASLLGLTPSLTQNFSRIEIASVAYAQDLLLKIDNYAKSVLQMEPLRIQALNQVQAELGSQTPKDVCRQNELPNAVKTICTNFFNQSAEIIRLNGLSNREFNQITEKVQMDSLYRQRLNEALLEQTK
ncbi:hypothetical protein C1752_00564 [Acaryochloris thomasi RCC1774]|uniref:DUF4168 domain-containing protein n=1 Tax=Acaryochloris thomasi RCC1774 TaxID=1764569 RepID=A0A2W1K795_9CYAN|nr:DUF4168 domain-containing protein [Acaryochloris thomasi]PZD75387.1 hypothetical protein C1752_00564 [Acaryochloris thomasi RCC1774]